MQKPLNNQQDAKEAFNEDAREDRKDIKIDSKGCKALGRGGRV